MAAEHILTLLLAERDKLNRAIEALGGNQGGGLISSGSHLGAPEPKATRKVSAAARRKMALGQKKRWAALKAAAK
jgi:hypothetical protein